MWEFYLGSVWRFRVLRVVFRLFLLGKVCFVIYMVFCSLYKTGRDWGVFGGGYFKYEFF